MSPLGRRVRVSFRQRLTGTYWRLDSPVEEHSIDLDFKAWFSDFRSYARHKTWTLRGSLAAENLASKCDIHGSITSRILEYGRVFYRFQFVGDDGRAYAILGQQEWSGLSPIESLTYVHGRLEDSGGNECGRVKLRFDPRWAGFA